MDLVVFLVIVILVVCFFRKFSSFIYIIGIIDLVLRVLTLIDANINWPSVNGFIKTYIPNSILAIINNNTTGIINVIAIWAYIVCLGIFIYYVFRTFLKKK